MDIRKIPFKKSMKFLTLLLTSMIIVTASATVYYSLSLESEVTVGAPVVKFVTAEDFTGDLTDSWVRLNLKSYPNTTLTYEKAINISNTDGSNGHTFWLTPGDPTGDSSSNWGFINYTVYNNAGAVQDTLNYTGGASWSNTGQTSQMTIGASEEWTIRVVTKSPSTAINGAVCNIVISVDVNE